MAKRTTKVRIEGLRELRENLMKVSAAVRSGLVLDVLEAHAEPIAAAAAEMAPVLSGNLRDSIGTSRRSKGYPRSRGVYTVFIGPTEAFSSRGFWQEFGTQHHAPTPFMRPSWDAVVSELPQKIANDLWAGIEGELKTP